MKLKTTVNDGWLDVRWSDCNEHAMLSFKLDAITTAERVTIMQAACRNDLDAVCNLWDTFVVRW